jgi:hypothetical protein
MKTTIAALLVIACAVSLLAASPAPAAITLSNGYVTPSAGHTGTLFSFYVTYKQTGGLAPTVKQVIIDGTGPFLMTPVSGSYTTGAQFRYQTYLAPGSHNFRFYFATAAESARLPSAGTIEGPKVSAVYNITDYFPLTGSWTYLTNYGGHVPGTETRTSLGGSPVKLYCLFKSTDGTISDDWFEYWSRSASGVSWHGMEDDGHVIQVSPPFLVPNGLYVGQTATTRHTFYITGAPATQGWCTYRLDGVERISVPYGTGDCLKLTITINSPWIMLRLQAWFARGLGIAESVELSSGGESVIDRLLSRTP